MVTLPSFLLFKSGFNFEKYPIVIFCMIRINSESICLFVDSDWRKTSILMPDAPWAVQDKWGQTMDSRITPIIKSVLGWVVTSFHQPLGLLVGFFLPVLSYKNVAMSDLITCPFTFFLLWTQEGGINLCFTLSPPYGALDTKEPIIQDLCSKG